VEAARSARLPAVRGDSAAIGSVKGLIDMAGQRQQLTWLAGSQEVVSQLFQHGCVEKVAAVAYQGGCGDEAAPSFRGASQLRVLHALPRAAIPASGVGQGPPDQAYPGFPIQRPGKRQPAVASRETAIHWMPAVRPSTPKTSLDTA
jgi:hypothetical protein